MALNEQQREALHSALQVALAAHDDASQRFVLFNAAVFCTGVGGTTRHLSAGADRSARDELYDERCRTAADLASVAVLVDEYTRRDAVKALSGHFSRSRMQLNHLLESSGDPALLRSALVERLADLGVNGSAEDDFAKLHQIKTSWSEGDHAPAVLVEANRRLLGIATEAISQMLSRPGKPTDRRDPLDDVLSVVRAAQLDAVERAGEAELTSAQRDVALNLAGKAWGMAVAAFARSSNCVEPPDPTQACREPICAMAAAEQME